MHYHKTVSDLKHIKDIRYKDICIACYKVGIIQHTGITCLCQSVRHKTSGPLLNNYWCNFITTLQEWSVPSLVVHIIDILQFNNFCQSYGPLMIFMSPATKYRRLKWIFFPSSACPSVTNSTTDQANQNLFLK